MCSGDAEFCYDYQPSTAHSPQPTVAKKRKCIADRIALARFPCRGVGRVSCLGQGGKRTGQVPPGRAPRDGWRCCAVGCRCLASSMLFHTLVEHNSMTTYAVFLILPYTQCFAQPRPCAGPLHKHKSSLEHLPFPPVQATCQPQYPYLYTLNLGDGLGRISISIRSLAVPHNQLQQHCTASSETWPATCNLSPFNL